MKFQMRPRTGRFLLLAAVIAALCPFGSALRAQESDTEAVKASEERQREEKQRRYEDRLSREYGDENLPGLVERAATTRVRERQREGALVREALKKGLPSPLNTEPLWNFLGPTVRTHRLPSVPLDDSGLVASIAVDPVDPKILFVASAGGGVWRTTDGGAKWDLVTSDIPALQFGAVAIAPSDSKRVYAGTGCADASSFRLGAARSVGGYPLRIGFGMIVSTDGGTTWTSLGRDNRPADYFWDILVDPQNPDIVLVAGDRGVQRSTDGGKTFTAVLRSEEAPWATKLSRPAGDSSTVYASTWGANIAGLVWKSTDGGQTWVQKSAGLPGDSETRGRVTVAVAPSNPNRVYALVNGYGAQLDMARSDDGGDTWSALNLASKKPTNPTSPESEQTDILKNQGDFCNVVGVDRSNPDIVWAGGTDGYASTDGGATWAWITDWRGTDPGRSYVHADFHVFAQLPDGTILFGTDGGVFASSDQGRTFKSLNRSMQTFLASGICHDVNNPDRIAMGAQDNGNSFRVQGTEWRETSTGDGFACFFHPTDANVVFASTQNQNVMRSTDAGQTFLRATNGLTDARGKQATFGTWFAWTTNPFRLYTFSKRKVWVTTDNGDTWSELAQNFPLTADIADLAVSPNGSTFAALDGQNNVHVSTDGGLNWERVSKVPAAYSAKIRLDPQDAKRIYVATRDPRAEKQRVWLSTDSGGTWTAISKTGEADGLPDLPLNAFEIDLKDNNVLWAGSFMGLYRSGDKGQTWRRHGQGLPNVPVMTIALLPDGSRVRVGTFGRGVWEVGATPGGLQVPSGPDASTLATPVAKFSFTPATPRPGESVEFKDQSTGAPSAWAWTFGKTGSSTVPDPSHVFASTGPHEVTLKITTSQGSFETTQTVTVAKPNTGTGDVLTYLLPIVLTSGGDGGTSYSSELTLTNRTSASLAIVFTAKGKAAGTDFESSASYTLTPGQEVKPDAFAFFKSIGMTIPADDQILASVRAAVTGTDEISGFGAQLRVTTPPNTDLAARGVKGNFGLAYAATPLTRGANNEAIVYGLQQNASTRSNLACVHAGGSSEPITLEVTYHDGTTRKADPTKDGTLTSFTPFEWKQSIRPLASRSIATGYAVIKKVSGTGQFVCYGVLNDNANGDGSFVPMVVTDVPKATSQAFVPVVLETGPYKSEVTLTNRDRNKMTAYLTLVLDSRPDDPEYVAYDLAAGEQLVVDNIMADFRSVGITLPSNPIGSLFIDFEQWADPEGTDEGGLEIPVTSAYAGVRTTDFSGVADNKGSFGLAYGYSPVGELADSEAWVLGLQQSGEKGQTDGTRSNLAIVNATGVDEEDIQVEISYFGPDGALLGQEVNCKPCTLKPGQWKQFGEVLKPFGVTHGFARIRKVAGNDQFSAYGVLNDQLNNDGSFVPMTIP